jgi:DNA polymerase III alpha subunit (gram-positive type)
MENDIRIYVDTEYIYSGMNETSGRPTSKDQREIVQISAVKFDNKSGKELDHFDILISPKIVSPFPPFFSKLTGISLEELEKGIPFENAVNKFLNFCEDFSIWTFDKDHEVFEQNFKFHKIESLFPKSFIRVKPLLINWNINPEDYSSGTLYKAAGLKMEGHVHNALHDVRSMSNAIHKLEKDNP